MNVQTKCTKKEYKEEVEQTQDAKKAISLAHYYSVKRDSFQLHVHNMHNNKGPVYNSRAVCWLCKAKEYLGKQNLSELIDIDKFLLNSSEFASDGIFDFDEGQEVVEAIVKCSTIKKLKFGPFVDYDKKKANRIGAFLSKTTFIEDVTLASCMGFEGNALNSVTITPIADALKINTSIKKLDLSDTWIGDRGVIKLISAIENNPNSKITDLNLYSCNITDESVLKLIELVHKMEQITWVNIRYDRISDNLEEELK